ncbi:hypothetical protein JKG47_20270 [Acidithiobacillus sp. MC6.1]|nr:hypothetical protein [Acidithiobacillus sp. MC6.1]
MHRARWNLPALDLAGLLIHFSTGLVCWNNDGNPYRRNVGVEQWFAYRQNIIYQHPIAAMASMF